jgi:hypothetical protein
MSCYGCEHHLANQLAHMDFGGCLYMDPDAAVSTPPSSPVSEPLGPTLTQSAPEFFPEPVACVVCVTGAYLYEAPGSVRRACGNTARCQEHQGKCAYCGDENCEDSGILCERCSYSGAGNAFIIEAILQPHTLCLYDRNPTSSEAWECGCPQCIQGVAAAYQGTAVNAELAFSLN